jgi:hypothetical protein
MLAGPRWLALRLARRVVAYSGGRELRQRRLAMGSQGEVEGALVLIGTGARGTAVSPVVAQAGAGTLVGARAGGQSPLGFCQPASNTWQVFAEPLSSSFCRLSKPYLN